MSVYSAMVTSDVTITQDNSQAVIPAGTIVLLTSGGALETAIGLGNLTNVSGLDQDLPAAAQATSN